MKITAENLNLDGEMVETLREFVAQIGQGVRPIKAARELFPDRPKGFVRATVKLRGYAWNKITAMELRLKGEISKAIQYEDICDRIYKQLPDFARW